MTIFEYKYSKKTGEDPVMDFCIKPSTETLENSVLEIEVPLYFKTLVSVVVEGSDLIWRIFHALHDAGYTSSKDKVGPYDKENELYSKLKLTVKIESITEQDREND